MVDLRKELLAQTLGIEPNLSGKKARRDSTEEEYAQRFFLQDNPELKGVPLSNLRDHLRKADMIDPIYESEWLDMAESVFRGEITDPKEIQSIYQGFINEFSQEAWEDVKRKVNSQMRKNGGRIGYALGGNEMLRDSRSGLGSMMAAGDETAPPMEILDPGFDTGPEELLQDIDREGMLRTAAMEDPMLGLVIQAYDQLKEQGQLPKEYLGPQGLDNFIRLEGERIIQAMQQQEQGAGIASLRA